MDLSSIRPFAQLVAPGAEASFKSEELLAYHKSILSRIPPSVLNIQAFEDRKWIEIRKIRFPIIEEL